MTQKKAKILIQSSLFIFSLIAFTQYCAKSPTAPIHSPTSSAALSSGGTNCANMQLVGTDSTLSIDPIKPVALAKLTLKNVKIQEDVPFPTLPFHFLTLSADVNDSMGGYASFTIQSLAKSGSSITEKVPSGVLRWVPNLDAANYKVSVIPCNSLGCREDLAQNTVYLQQANNFPKLKTVSDSFNECLGILNKLQNSAESLVRQAQSAGQYFAKGNELKLATSSSSNTCASPGQTSMENIEKLGAPYVGEILSNPDAINTESKQLSLAAQSQSGTETITVTETATSTATAATQNSTAKTVLLSLGVVGIVTGLMLFVASVAPHEGWAALTGGVDAQAEKILNDLSQKHYTIEQSRKLVGDSNLDENLKKTLNTQLNEKEKLTESNFAKSVTDDKPSYDFSKNQSFLQKHNTLVRTISGVGGVLAAIGGAVAVGVSQSLGLATSTEMEAATSNDSFEKAANYITNTVLPLQDQLRTCTVTLMQNIDSAAN